MNSVSGQQDEHDEIGDQQSAVESVGVVEALESLIQQMLAEVRPDAFGAGPGSQCGRQDEIRAEQGIRSKRLFYRIRCFT